MGLRFDVVVDDLRYATPEEISDARSRRSH